MPFLRGETTIITAIEMFAGIGGFRLGLEANGIAVAWANDIDPLACQIYQSRFGVNSIVEGDIYKALDTIPEHDVLTAGFPCQPFSQAGKKLGIKCSEQGTLFEAIASVLETHRPRWFVLENVKRLLTMEKGIHFRRILSDLGTQGYLIEWRLMNSKHFGLAQNRERVIIVGTRLREENTIVEMLQNYSTLLTPKCVEEWQLWHFDGSARTMQDLISFDQGFERWGIAWNGKVLTLPVQEMIDIAAPIRLEDILEHDVDSSFDMTERTLEWIHKNQPVNALINGVEILSNQEGGRRMGYTIFGTSGIAPTVTASTSRHYERYLIQSQYRRLTNIEYARLQGFPDTWCEIASVYDQYRLYGNAVPPPMIRWVTSRLGQSNIESMDIARGTLFAMEKPA